MCEAPLAASQVRVLRDMGVAYRGTCSLDSDQERYEETGSKPQPLHGFPEPAIFQTLFSSSGRLLKCCVTHGRQHNFSPGKP